MKAVRGEISPRQPQYAGACGTDDNEIRGRLHNCDDQRLFVIFEALKRGISCEEIRDITKIDIWFLYKLNNLAKIEKELVKGFDNELYLKAKKLGYPDRVIERISGQKIKKPISAAFKMVDTCAAEFPAETPYFYSTFDHENEAEEFNIAPTAKTVMVFGSGPIR